ncbi:uncharacterized protein EAE98_003211 [Botrytis deweyae]|uniref:BTB domain-containing protein n=1 Tax=Botrytis deweyae TaxID=2478750 RepID=A0ABQ7IVY0_9HELO|nr:uncharacterized protein EAE98_003211 [Botrytis deweyae]KAF7935166.1 hypothetical protein EAE98_003211 [Botrytis deweyae]
MVQSTYDTLFNKNMTSTGQVSTTSVVTKANYFDWQDNSSLKLGKQMITITVGAHKKKFLVHADLINLQPRIFRRLRISRSVDTGDSSGWFDVYQPISCSVFVRLLQFSYHGKLFPGISIDTLWHLYLFAHKNKAQDLEDIIMNRIMTTHRSDKQLFPEPRHIELGYNYTKENSAGRKFLALCYAAMMHVNTKLPSIYNKEVLVELGKKCDGLLIDVSNLTNGKGSINISEWDPRYAPECLYHHHA